MLIRVEAAVAEWSVRVREHPEFAEHSDRSAVVAATDNPAAHPSRRVRARPECGAHSAAPAPASPVAGLLVPAPAAGAGSPPVAASAGPHPSDVAALPPIAAAYQAAC